jgi:hypothetical protein
VKVFLCSPKAWLSFALNCVHFLKLMPVGGEEYGVPSWSSSINYNYNFLILVFLELLGEFWRQPYPSNGPHLSVPVLEQSSVLL